MGRAGARREALPILVVHGLQKETVLLSLKRARADDLPRIVDSCGFLQYPSRVLGHQPVQVLHLSAFENERVEHKVRAVAL